MTDVETRAFTAATIRDECTRMGLGAIRILLFGSRARDAARPDSDWDFLVELDRELGFSERALLATRIRRRLARRGIASDLVFKSPRQLDAEQGNVGFISYYALKEGLPL